MSNCYVDTLIRIARNAIPVLDEFERTEPEDTRQLDSQTEDTESRFISPRKRQP